MKDKLKSLTSHHAFWLSLGLCLVYALMLGARPLNNPDESRYSDIALEMLRRKDFIVPYFNGVLFLDKPPLYYWLQAIAIKAFGLNNGALRFFPALCAILGCACSFYTAKRLFSKNVGLLSAAILISSPLYYFIGLYANLDMEVATFITMALLFFALALFNSQTPKEEKRFYRLAYFFSALAFLTKGFIGVVLPMLAVGLWLLLSQQWHRLKSMYIVQGLTIVFLVNLPWYILIEKKVPGFSHFFFYEQQINRFLSHQFNAHNPWFFYPLLILGGLFPWSVFIVQTSRFAFKEIVKQNQHALPLLFFASWAITTTVFFSIPASKLASYIIPALPPIAILLAHYLIESGLKNSIIRYAFATLASINGLCLIGVITLPLWLTHMTATGWVEVILALVGLNIASLLIIPMKNRLKAYLGLTLASFLSCTLITLSVPYWIDAVAEQKPTIASTSKLAQVIKQYPQLKLYSYKSFYYDLPILLEQSIKVVYDWGEKDLAQHDSWAGKFAFGQFKQGKPNANLVPLNDFWQKWQGQAPILVITRLDHLNEFKHYQIISQFKRNILISNSANQLNQPSI